MNNNTISPNIDISQAEDIICEKCGNYTFEQVFLMKKVSALISPTGKTTIIPIPAFACNACGHINREMLPVIPNKTDRQIPTDTKPNLTLL
jgi:uncharacterized Zn finger protein